jgi:hypothetical protein
MGGGHECQAEEIGVDSKVLKTLLKVDTTVPWLLE